jgi:hypothetical protein
LTERQEAFLLSQSICMPFMLKCPISHIQSLEISTESCYRRDARMKERRGGAGACPRGVAEFTKTVAEFTKSSLAGQKGLQVLMILFIFVAIIY